ncbi:hypothetical protein SDC9_38619 [bioreactor metagenome]|uniref:Uncharacterized protein n=1 Tax=bioreactor metagenome TaxID=1076179 RepID=A0A644VME9_9ZZZZ
MESEHLGFRVGDAETVLHDPCPHATGGTEFRHFLEEIVVGVEKEGKTLSEYVGIETFPGGGFHVGDAVGEGEGHFLDSGASGLADVISGNGDGVPLRHVLAAELENIRDKPHGRLRGEDVGSPGDVFLEDVVLDGSRKDIHGHALFLPHADVHGEENARGSVDRHGGGDLVQGDLVEKDFHVLKTVNGHSHFSAFTLGHGVVGIVAYLGGKVEGHGKAGRSLGEEIAVSLVGLFGGGESRILAHGPEPAPVHGRLDASRKGVLAGEPDIPHVIHGVDVVRTVEPPKGESSPRRKAFLSLFVLLKRFCNACLELRSGIFVLRIHACIPSSKICSVNS